MGLADDLGIEEEQDEQTTSSSGEKQHKSLIANTYSTKTLTDRKDISDWRLNEQQVRLAFGCTSPRHGSGGLKKFLDGLRAGGHEEWYSELQVALAHMVVESPYATITEFEELDIEPRGAVPVLELLSISAGDIAAYLQSEMEENPEMVRQLRDALNDMDIPDEQEEEPEPAEADD